MSASIRPTSTRTIGVIADWYDEHYQHTILSTLEEATAQRGVSLRAFACGIPGSDVRQSSLRSRALQLASPHNVDGVVVLAGTLVNELGVDGIAALLAPLSAVPRCALGVELPGVPSIVIDNQAGVDQAMRHLVEHHGCKQVAFIRGPNKNTEAESRFCAYREALEREAIAYDERLTFQGDFLSASGVAAIAHFREHGLMPQAIIAANDVMALGAQQALVAAGVRIPEQIRVIGFDDIALARSGNPPLTTVRQPLSELAVASVRTVMDQLGGREVPLVQMLQTHLVVRDSCGCEIRLTSSGRSVLPDEEGPSNSHGFESEFQRARPALRRELARIARGELLSVPDWENSLMNAFQHQVLTSDESFAQTLRQFLSQSADTEGRIARFHDIVTAFRRTALSCAGSDADARSRLENMLHEARLIVARAVERKHREQLMASQSDIRAVLRSAAAVTGAFSFEALQKALMQNLSSIGVTACIIVGYLPLQLGASRPPNAPPPRSRVLAAVVQDGPEIRTQGIGTEFETETLVPNTLLPSDRAHHASVLPLFHRGAEMGYCVVESRRRSTPVFELLREQLSVAVYGCLLASEDGLSA